MLCFAAGAHLAEDTRNARRTGNIERGVGIKCLK